MAVMGSGKIASCAVAKQLWLLRHGDAVPHGSRDTDADRELTPRGERQATAAGRALARLGVEFAACYTSPKLRALDTARLACASLGVEPVEERSLATGFDREAATTLLHAHGDGKHVLVVGHNPDFAQLVYDLTGARLDFKKGGIAAARLDGSRAELVALLRPRELEALAEAR
jgi:phosphohistidine phosphatase